VPTAMAGKREISLADFPLRYCHVRDQHRPHLGAKPPAEVYSSDSTLVLPPERLRCQGPIMSNKSAPTSDPQVGWLGPVRFTVGAKARSIQGKGRQKFATLH